MRTSILLATATLVSMTLLAGCCYAQSYVPMANEELYGTWTNDKTINTFHIQKMVVNAGGFKEYSNVTASDPSVEVSQQIQTKWKDSSGVIWYKVFGKINTGVWKGRNFKSLERLNKAATVLEMVVNAFQGDLSSSDYPNKIEKASAFNGGYRIFYRK